jgi:acetyl-CoA carboxylase beta subunit/acetyl-CoA carboxylase alpha subunit
MDMRGSAKSTFDDLGFDAFAAEDAAGEFELTCPSCDHLLSGDTFYENFRVCPQCHRHFWLPARERVTIVADYGSFRETNSEVVSVEPLVFQDAWPATDRSGAHFPAGETVVTGKMTIGGREAVLVVVDMAMTPGSIGIVTGERICLAFEDAAHRRVPLIAICSGGVQTDRESLLTFAQKVRIASVVGRLQRNSVPFVSVLTHPTTGAFFTGLGNHASIIFAEPAAQLGLGSSRLRGPVDMGTASSEEMLAAGMIDGIVERTALRDRLVTTLDVLTSRGTPRPSASPVWSTMPRGRGSDDPVLAHTPSRPSPADYFDRLRLGLIEIRGDRSGTADPNLIAGIGQIEGVSVALIGLRRAPLSAAGFRTVVRLHRLAGQLEIPVVALIDSPGLPDVSAVEGAALSNAIAQTMRVAVSLPIPTVAVVTGVAAGPGTMSLAVADRVYMLEHAIFSTSGLDRPTPPGIAPASQGGFWGARESLRLGVVDGVIPEPAGGAHVDPDGAAQQLRLTIVHALAELNGIGQRRLLDERSRKLRHLGLATPAGREALHIEIAQLHEIQQTLSRSIDELRGRLELHQLGLPNLPSLPQRPAIGQLPPLPHVDLSGLPTRPSLPAMRRPGRGRAEMSYLAERFAATRRGLAERMQDVRATLETLEHPETKEPPAND